jgi:hypothetical protein
VITSFCGIAFDDGSRPHGVLNPASSPAGFLRKQAASEFRCRAHAPDAMQGFASHFTKDVAPSRETPPRWSPQSKASFVLWHFAKSWDDDFDHSALSWAISHIVGRAIIITVRHRSAMNDMALAGNRGNATFCPLLE